MKIKTVWAVYFSGTGTTGKIVTTIAAAAAEQLHAPCNTLDFTLPAPREHSYHFSTGDLVIFGTPVIAGRVPNVLRLSSPDTFRRKAPWLCRLSCLAIGTMMTR